MSAWTVASTSVKLSRAFPRQHFQTRRRFGRIRRHNNRATLARGKRGGKQTIKIDLKNNLHNTFPSVSQPLEKVSPRHLGCFWFIFFCVITPEEKLKSGGVEEKYYRYPRWTVNIYACQKLIALCTSTSPTSSRGEPLLVRMQKIDFYSSSNKPFGIMGCVTWGLPLYLLHKNWFYFRQEPPALLSLPLTGAVSCSRAVD